MYPESMSEPVSIRSSRIFDAREDGPEVVALAAYLLTAGVIHTAIYEESRGWILPPEYELEATGIRSVSQYPIKAGDISLREVGPDGTTGLGTFAEWVSAANESGDPYAAARAIAAGLHSENELIRVCALGSAIDFFFLEEIDLVGQIAWFARNVRQELTAYLVHTILARILPTSALGFFRSAQVTPSTTAVGLMAVHGTVLPHSQSNRPEWSVPGTGKLFAHLESIRPDIYKLKDHYRWEGGYTDYAREVAAAHLADWVNRRGLNGIDVVAHSHGCNVVIAATNQQTRFNKMLLMNCPVHWSKYKLPSSLITSDVVSARINFDLVILADRGGQRFPPGTIKDEILPSWYVGHSDLTKPNTWIAQNIGRFLL